MKRSSGIAALALALLTLCAQAAPLSKPVATNAAAVRATIACLSQDARIFDDTIAGNLRIGAPAAPDAALWRVVGLSLRVSGTACLLGAVAGLLLVVLGGSVPLAALGAVLWGIGASLGFPVGMSAGADDPAHSAARVSVVSSIGYTAFLAGPPLIGFLADRLAKLGVEDQLFKSGAVAGSTVIIGAGNGVIFDWEPTMAAGAELLGRRGTDLRVEEMERSARATRSEKRTEQAGRLIAPVWSRVLRLFRKPTPDDLPTQMVAARASAVQTLRDRWLVATWATVLTSATKFALLLMCLRFIGIGEGELRWTEVFVVFALVQGLTVFPITAGDAGVSEIAYIGLLTAAAGSEFVNQITAAILVFRILTWLVIIPAGLGTLGLWKYQLRRITSGVTPRM